MKNGGINMCMRKLKIGLDCDDVLYKCNSYVIQLENLKRTTEQREMLDFDSLTSYEAAGNELDIRFEYFKSREFYESQPVIEGAQAFVSELVGMGHDVFILTSIDSKYGDIRRQRISEDFPDVKSENVFISSRKDIFSVDIMLDDAVHNLQGERAVNTPFPILMKRPWNEDCRGIMSVLNYDEFIELVRYIEFSNYVGIGFNYNNVCNLIYVNEANKFYEQYEEEEAEPCRLISFEEMMKKYCTEMV